MEYVLAGLLIVVGAIVGIGSIWLQLLPKKDLKDAGVKFGQGRDKF